MKMGLCQINIAHCRYPLDHPAMKDFVDALDYVNSIADEHPGFIWRFKSDESDELSPWPDDILPNMSMWKSREDLMDYVYKTDHMPYLRRKGEWFKKMSTPHLVLWWAPIDPLPTLGEGFERLRILGERGPTEKAFTLAQAFEPVICK